VQTMSEGKAIMELYLLFAVAIVLIVGADTLTAAIEARKARRAAKNWRLPGNHPFRKGISVGQGKNSI
jgi:hypothetical protein